MARAFFIRLYPEHIEFINSLPSLLDGYILRYAGILHDKDEDVEDHYHVVVVCKSDHTVEQVSKAFNIETRHIRVRKGRNDVRMAVRYLIHKDTPQKYQYPIEEIFTNDWDWVNSCLDDNEKVDETEQLAVVFDAIMCDEIRSTSQLLKFALYNDMYSAVRRSYHMLKDIIKERNMKQYCDLQEVTQRAIEHLGTVIKAEDVAVYKALYIDDLARKKGEYK